MRPNFFLSKSVKNVFILILAFSLTLNIETYVRFASTEPVSSSGLFNYKFIVDENGFTFVNITYYCNEKSGSSWVFIPKFQEWTNRTIKGKVVQWVLEDTENYTNNRYYFYEVLNFSFVSESSGFGINFMFNFSTAAIIIEPNGIFLSPQIGFEGGNTLRAEVILPQAFNINKNEAAAYGISSYQPNPVSSNSNYVLFDNIPKTENLIRIEVGFKTLANTPDLLTIQRGIFTFEAARRYENFAYEILDLYNKTYADFVRLFNVTLESTQIRFFVPDFDSLLSIGGYVPISGEDLQEIYINIAFTRYVKGYIEIIALHELIHYFLWRAGVSPQTLWFHEGIAQYVSIEVANSSGYEGAGMMKQELEDEFSQLKKLVGNDLGFLKEWSPLYQPKDTGTLYVAAYYVVSRLSEPLGGLRYYASFFRLINNKKVNDNVKLSYYLSLAANESIIATLNSWGFGIPDLYILSYDIEEMLSKVNPIFQPYKFLAELLYKQALSNTKDAAITSRYLAATILIAKLAPLLTLFTAAAILFIAILLALEREGVFKN